MSASYISGLTNSSHALSAPAASDSLQITKQVKYVRSIWQDSVKSSVELLPSETGAKLLKIEHFKASENG